MKGELGLVRKTYLPAHRSSFFYIMLLKISAIKYSISLHREMDGSRVLLKNALTLSGHRDACECTEEIIYWGALQLLHWTKWHPVAERVNTAFKSSYIYLYLFQRKWVQRQLLYLKMTHFQMACWDLDDLLSTLAADGIVTRSPWRPPPAHAALWTTHQSKVSAGRRKQLSWTLGTWL